MHMMTSGGMGADGKGCGSGGGQAMQEPSSTEKDFLRRFINGDLNDLDRQAVCEMLPARPVWLAWVAEEVRRRRSAVGAAV